MPTYEYACKECGQHLEVVQSFEDEPLRTCSLCGGPLRKVFGAIGIAFKGSGFYKTDSRRPAKTAGSEPSSSTAASSSAASSSAASSSSPSSSSPSSSSSDGSGGGKARTTEPGSRPGASAAS